MTTVNNPPLSVPLVDKDGKINITWSGWFLRLYNRVGGATGGFAPNDVTFITQTPSSDLSQEQALSLLSSGFMKVTNGSGVITSTGSTTIQTADIGNAQVTAAKLADTTVVAGSYGSPSQIATFTVDQQGRLTAAGNTPIDFSAYVPYTGATSNVNIGTYTYIGHAFKADATDGILLEASDGTDIGILGASNTANVTWYGNHNFNTATASTIAVFGSSKTLSSGSIGTGLDLTSGTLSISSSYTGQSSITTLGTISTGVWQGTAITTSYGGTGLTSYTQGDILYYNTGTTLSKLAKDTNSTRYLSNQGTSNNPSWNQVNLTNGVTGTLPVGNGGTGVTSLGDLTRTSDTNVTLTLGGTPTGSLINSVSITAGWSGTLAVSRGGTGTGTASIAAFNNITGYTASGATGTTSTNLVFSTSPTITTPVINQINDSNGNEVLKFASVASAVNELTITNSSTPDPTISATGSDTNININFQIKGTAAYNFLGTSSAQATLRFFEDTDNGTNYVGIQPPASITSSIDWILPATDTTNGVWKSNGSSQLSCGLVSLTTNVTGTLPVANGGTGVTSSTGSGNVVLSTSPTLVTPVLGTPSSGTLTNCTGLPESGITGSAWTTFTATVTGFSSTTSVAGRYKQIGKIMHLSLEISGTSNATGFTITNLPAAPVSSIGTIYIPAFTINNSVNSISMVSVSGSSTTMTVYKDAAGNAWTNSGTKALYGYFIYEVA